MDDTGTVAEIARVLRMGESTIRGYATSGKIRRTGVTLSEHNRIVPVYSVADVVRVADEAARRRDGGWLVAWSRSPTCPLPRTSVIL